MRHRGLRRRWSATDSPAPALAQADLGIAIGAGTDVAVETADVVLMRSDPLDVAVALRIGRGTVRKMRQNLGWAIGYNAIALPIAAGVFEPAFGLVLRPEIAAITMAGSSIIVAVNALTLKRLRLPEPVVAPRAAAIATASVGPVSMPADVPRHGDADAQRRLTALTARHRRRPRRPVGSGEPVGHRSGVAPQPHEVGGADLHLAPYRCTDRRGRSPAAGAQAVPTVARH